MASVKQEKSWLRRLSLTIIPAAAVILLLNHEKTNLTITTKNNSPPNNNQPPALPQQQHAVRHRHLLTKDIPAITSLIPNTPNDLRDFCLALRSLESLAVTDESLKQAPVFAFHEGDITPIQKETIRACTDRPVYFPVVNFDFPPGFDVSTEMENSKMARTVATGGQNLGRPAWGYAQMIRFWTSRVWKHEALAGYDSIMRIDTDSCFINGGDEEDLNLPGVMKRYVYRSKGPGTGINQWIDGLYDFAVEYMRREGITPANPELWKVIEDTWKENGVLRTVGTNFEVSRLSFFRRTDVAKWLDALTESPPYGVFRHRWGDAQTRVLTLAMFAKKENILLRVHPGYVHGREFIKQGVMGPSKCAQYFTQYGRIDETFEQQQ
eukprot:CAMPEP_0172504144 /NCGR_PEP_ID=MMETSP1066-20121228/175857_1 /TAXON_ID=671091 /ORGANISM="Coscinodiscus wailesii, Strain CCMP2513" /LENGTH=379 /DNA_ID=CAMNT_0013280173 /DNA_START=11 /DNA_END=1150 /DNA_ORIENTATION=+